VGEAEVVATRIVELTPEETEKALTLASGPLEVEMGVVNTTVVTAALPVTTTTAPVVPTTQPVPPAPPKDPNVLPAIWK
jgi:hypothetical protein